MALKPTKGTSLPPKGSLILTELLPGGLKIVKSAWKTTSHQVQTSSGVSMGTISLRSIEYRSTLPSMPIPVRSFSTTMVVVIVQQSALFDSTLILSNYSVYAPDIYILIKI
jgi:hypothetical protein